MKTWDPCMGCIAQLAKHLNQLSHLRKATFRELQHFNSVSITVKYDLLFENFPVTTHYNQVTYMYNIS